MISMDSTDLALIIQEIQLSLKDISKQVGDTYKGQKSIGESVIIIRKDLDSLMYRWQADMQKVEELIKFEKEFSQIITLEDLKQLKTDTKLNNDFRLQKQYVPSLVAYLMGIGGLLTIAYNIFKEIFSHTNK